MRVNGRGARNRTQARGFGDPCTTTIRRPLAKQSLRDYFVSLCKICFLHLGQSFFSCNLSLIVFLLRVV